MAIRRRIATTLLGPVRWLAGVAMAMMLTACAAPSVRLATGDLRQQVMDTERAFADTMARRDHAGFVSFLAADTVFFTGPKPLRGRQQVADAWARFYRQPQAPFSWRPQDVEVLDSGDLALSAGPVFDPAGNPIGSFMSIWRLEAPGRWRIIFDRGCNCTPP